MNPLILAFLLQFSTTKELLYEIIEEFEAGNFVGQIPRKTQNHKVLFFKLSHDLDSSYFSVEKETGIIRTVQVIHRESLLRCRGQRDCNVTFKVGAASDDEFRTYNIKVRILDVNNNPPTFYPDYVKFEVEDSANFTEFELPTPYDYDSPLFGIKSCFSDPHVGWTELSSEDPGRLKIRIDNRRVGIDNVQVHCIDFGSPALRGSLTIEISKKTNKSCLRPRFDYKTLTISLSPPFTSEMVVTKLRAFYQSNDLSRSIEGISTIRFGFVGNAKGFWIDTMDGTVRIKNDLMTARNPIRLNASVCCGQLCDYCLIYVEFTSLNNVSENAVQISVSNVGDSDLFEISTSSKPGTPLAYVAVESNANGVTTCYVEPSGILGLKYLSDRSFLLVSQNQPKESKNNTTCLELFCDIDRTFFGSNTICVSFVGKHVVHEEFNISKKESKHLRLTYAMSVTIIAIMFFIFAIFVVVKFLRHYSAEKINLPSDHIDMRQNSTPKNDDATKSSVYLKETFSSESGTLFVAEDTFNGIYQSFV